MNGRCILPGDTLTVVIADDSRFIHLQEQVQYRTVQIKLTDEQRRAIALQYVGCCGKTEIFESIANCWIEPEVGN